MYTIQEIFFCPASLAPEIRVFTASDCTRAPLGRQVFKRWAGDVEVGWLGFGGQAYPETRCIRGGGAGPAGWLRAVGPEPRSAVSRRHSSSFGQGGAAGSPGVDRCSVCRNLS